MIVPPLPKQGIKYSQARPPLPNAAPQVMPYPSTVKVDNYVHLYNSGYAGGWGWAWFNVTEKFDYATGAATRGIGEHKCRGTLRLLLSGLPSNMKYSARTTPEVPATTPATTLATATASATASATAPATTTAAATAGSQVKAVPEAATRPATAAVAAAAVSRPVTVAAPAVTG